MIYHSYFQSPVGLLHLESDGSSLTGLHFTAAATYAAAELPVFADTAAWLDAYFRGQPFEPHIPICLDGTPFQKQVWQILRSIPYGEVRTYGDIAREMTIRTGKPKMSAQAVGQAVGRNPVGILIPCHRVVGAGNRLTGYAGGLDKKVWLLRQEGWLK